MYYIKTKAEIEAIRAGGKILAKILDTLVAAVAPGVNTADLEQIMMTMLAEAGGRAAFKDFHMGGKIYFPSAICASINDEVVHGSALPGRILNEGDIIDLDIGMEWPIKEQQRAKLGLPSNPHSKLGGFYTDMCQTVAVGKISQEAQQLLQVTKKCLALGIAQVKPGASLNDIGTVIQNYAESFGYGVVRDLVGHGVGYQTHEAPDIFHYAIDPKSPENIILEEGMVICIEPMINQGTHKVKVAKNGYAILSADKSLSAHFEHTILVSKNGPDILTLR